MRTLLLALVLLLAAASSAAAGSPSPSPSRSSLLESRSTHAQTDSMSMELRVPDEPDTKCVKLGFASSACPNVDWETYAWIQKQAMQTRVIDSTLEVARAGASGTRMCKRWYMDLMCRLVYPKCSESGEQGGPCRSECERFSRTCPGLAMSCAAFDEPSKVKGARSSCWETKYAFVYGSSERPVSAATHAPAPAWMLASVLLAAGLMQRWQQ